MEDARVLFQELFGTAKTPIRVFFAPGRINLIGEHIDYNGGEVLPAALDLGVWMLMRPRNDHRFRFASTNFCNQVEISTKELRYRESDGFANYPKGVITLLGERGVEIPGFDCLFHSNLPAGAGLSSSAAIEVVTAYAATRLANYSISNIEIARLAQAAENQYVGVQCGIMDQFAVAMGKRRCAMRLNCDTLEFEYVPIDLGLHVLIIMDSRKPRSLMDSLYNERRRECDVALAHLQKAAPHVTNLAALSPLEWERRRSDLPDAILQRRVDHVVSENARVGEAVDCLRGGDIARFGALLTRSHGSLANDYEVTGPELDALVNAAEEAPGCIGSRMTGAGFGGCAIALVQSALVDEFYASVRRRYRVQSGYEPAFYVSQIGGGVREVTEDLTC